MTLDELFNCNADVLQKMTDEELVKYFEPYFKITRPDQAAHSRKQFIAPALSPDMQMKLKQLASLGIDVSIPIRRKK